MIFIKPLEILDKACFLTMKKSYDEYFKTNNDATSDESMEYAIDNTAKALQEVILHKNYNYFSRDENVRDDLINCGVTKIKSELLKHVVKTYSYYEKNNTLNGKHLNYDFNKTQSYQETLSVVYLSMVKYGISKIQSALDDENVIKKLAKSFVMERIKYDRKKELENSLDDAGRFLINAIESYYSKTKEV
ncbi:MAG: hypothetical protein ACI4OG_02770 [Bacilli bacterium]